MIFFVFGHVAFEEGEGFGEIDVGGDATAAKGDLAEVARAEGNPCAHDVLLCGVGFGFHDLGGLGEVGKLLVPEFTVDFAGWFLDIVIQWEAEP